MNPRMLRMYFEKQKENLHCTYSLSSCTKSWKAPRSTVWILFSWSCLKTRKDQLSSISHHKNGSICYIHLKISCIPFCERTISPAFWTFQAVHCRQASKKKVIVVLLRSATPGRHGTPALASDVTCVVSRTSGATAYPPPSPKKVHMEKWP